MAPRKDRFISALAELPEWKSVRKFTDEELKKFLEHNDVVDATILAMVCSEILRRKLCGS